MNQTGGFMEMQEDFVRECIWTIDGHSSIFFLGCCTTYIFCVTYYVLLTCTQLSGHGNYQYLFVAFFFLIAFLQIKQECSAPAVHKVCPTREPIAPSNGRKKLDLPVQKNILTNYFCILSTYCNFSHEYVTSIKFAY